MLSEAMTLGFLVGGAELPLTLDFPGRIPGRSRSRIPSLAEQNHQNHYLHKDQCENSLKGSYSIYLNN